MAFFNRLNEAIAAFKGVTKPETQREIERSYGEGMQDITTMAAQYGQTVASFNLFNKQYVNKQYDDEVNKLKDYRDMAIMPEIFEVLEDATNEATQQDDEGDILKLEIIDDDLESNQNAITNIEDAFHELFHDRLEINKNIDDWFFNYLIDGRVYIENIIDQANRTNGIQRVKKLPSETMDFEYDPRTGRINWFVQYMAPGIASLPTTFEEAATDSKKCVAFYPDQITYIDTGKYGKNRKDVIGYLDKVKQPYNQLKLLETSAIIYRLVRAPQRFVFKIDVGNMPIAKANAYVEKIKMSMQKKVAYDPRTGTTTNEPDVISMLENFYLPQCISLSTKISLLDGRELALKDVISEFEIGKELYAYSVDQSSGRVIPGKIKWAGVTRKNAKLIKVILDNNQEIVCTPDHKFVMRDGSEVEAQHLISGSSLMPLYRKQARINTHKEVKNRYEMVLNNSNGKWEFTHRIMGPQIDKGMAIHHIDFNRFNNNPSNLKLMDIFEHIAFHRDSNKERWAEKGKKEEWSSFMKKKWEDPTFREKVSNGMKKKFAEDGSLVEAISERAKASWKNEDFRAAALKGAKTPKTERQKEIARENMLAYNSTEEGKQAIVVTSRKKMKKADEECLNILFKYWLKLNNPSEAAIRRALITDDYFCEKWAKLNPDNTKMTHEVASQIIRWNTEYSGYTEFRNNIVVNHSVKNIEVLDYREDTGCLVIEDPRENHNFALSAGVFVKNSSGGRGSSIDTVGGDATGFKELDDIYFFQRKLYRALKYPLSRVSAMQERTEKDLIFANNTAGQITQDEVKWSRFLKKHQDRFTDALTELFLLHMHFIGLKEEYDLSRSKIKITMTVPNNFLNSMWQEEKSAKLDAFQKYTDFVEKGYFSKYYLLRHILQMSDEEIKENVDGFVKDVELGLTKVENPEDMPQGVQDKLGGGSGSFGDMSGGEAPAETVGGEENAPGAAGKPSGGEAPAETVGGGGKETGDEEAPPEPTVP